MAAVIRITGAIAQNPNLLTLAGTDPDKSFGEVRFDFGNSSPVVTGWNKLQLSSSLSDAGYSIIDSVINTVTGIPTSIKVSSSESFRANATGTDQNVNYPDGVGTDSVFVGDVNGVNITEGEIYFDGLSKKRLYTFEIFASRMTTGGSDGRLGYYNLNGRTGQLDANDNIVNTVQLSKVATDETGRVTLKIECRESMFAYINAIKITEE